MEVDMPKIFDSLRIMAIEEGVVSEPKIALFHRLFLESIKRWGRVFEAELIGLYKLKTGTLFSDAKAGQKMFIKGKISLLPKPIKSRSSVKEMFRR
jgi:heterodisulfide reductase subunit C